MGAQEARWGQIWGCTRRGYAFFYVKSYENHQLGQDFFLRNRITSAVKKLDFVDGRMSYTVIRSGMCDIIVLNLGMDGRIILQLSLKQ